MKKKPVKSRKSQSQTLKVKKLKNDQGVLKLPVVTDPATRSEIIDSIFRAFYLKKMKYTHRLVYDHPSVPRSMNNADLDDTEGGVQGLSEEN